MHRWVGLVRVLFRSSSALVLAAAAVLATASVTRAELPVASFELVAPATGTLPFTTGLGFEKGEIPGVPTLDGVACQVIVKRRWNDGSVKHAIATGEVALVAGTPRTITVSGLVSSPPATPLTAADIEAASPAASVQLGALGTVSLGGLLSTPFRTWLSGPQMVEAHYRSAAGGDPTLVVWFHVRLHAAGRVWIRAVVENGALDLASSSRSYAPTVTIGGTVVFDNGGAMLTHHAHTRWTAEGWIGGDPQVAVRLDAADLMATKLVPRYFAGVPADGTLDNLTQTYEPNQPGGWTESMSQTGFQDQIGLLPRWDALYLTSGADPRAQRSVLANAKALNSYSIVWIDSVTMLPVRPSDRPNWSLFGDGQGGGNPPAAGDLSWESAHHGSGGYLAYLITGDYFHLETMEHQAALCYLWTGAGYGHGLGNERLFLSQTRNHAWSVRTVGQLAAIAPLDPLVEDYRALIANDAQHWHDVIQTPGINALGYVYSYEAGSGAYSSSAAVTAPWQHHFWVQAYGHVNDLEPLASMATFRAVLEHFYKAPVGILGGAGSESYCYANASSYTLQIGDTPDGDPNTWYDSWGTAFERSTGSPNDACGDTLLGGSGGSPSSAAMGYWGNLLPAIAYAVDHGAPGAAEAWGRLTTATNWPTVLDSGFESVPNWGIGPRPSEPSTAPSPPARLRVR